MPVADLMERVVSDPRLASHIAHIRVIPPSPAAYDILSDPVPGIIQRYLETNGIRLYAHQCRTIEALRKGEHIILTTSTASGKTLAYLLPVFESLAIDPAASALCIYPTKALTYDQLKSVQSMEEGTGLNLKASVYDGDTPRDRRPRIRESSRIVLSNPFELHQILPWHHQWAGFFSSLRYVVIDEAHRYRGVFGSHAAFLLKRLRRICLHYGSDPRFILSSATLANPREFARKLTGLSFTLINEDSAPKGRRHFVLYNPFHSQGETSSAIAESSLLLAEGISSNLQMLCFAGSRKAAEIITLTTKDQFIRKRSEQHDRIASYRAGYLPEERRGIENRLKSGSLKGVVSTNALELGIDIGSLDGVILAGYPGTMMATWQQAGRAGRSAEESVAVLVASGNPLDQYFMRHPDTFFSSPHEHAIIDTGNPYILSGQVLCAASELPLTENDSVFFGSDLMAAVTSHEKNHLLSRTRRGWVYSGSRRPAELIGLDNGSRETFRVICDGRLLETMDRAQAYREAHKGAILLHQGEQYLVDSLDLESHIIRVSPVSVDYHTRPLKSVNLIIERELVHTGKHGFPVHYGDVRVCEACTGYQILHYNTLIGTEPLDLPPLEFSTKSLWFTIPAEIETSVIDAGRDFGGGLHGIEHAFIAMMPFYVMCDRWDIGGVSAPAPCTGSDPVVHIYDGYEGGIGLSEKAFEVFPAILGKTWELVRDCTCAAGCPACIYSPKCGNDNQPLDRAASLLILQGLLSRMKKEEWIRPSL